jgi:HSP20 family protein
MEEKDVDVKLANGVLTIRGEKRDEKEEKNKNYYVRTFVACHKVHGYCFA